MFGAHIRHIPCALVTLIAIATGEARAQPKTSSDASIEYQAAKGCPAKTWLSAQVARYLGRAPSGVRAEVSVSQKSGVWTVAVHTHTSAGDGEVTHQGPDCSVLVDVAALIIAVAIDPTAGPGKVTTPAKTAAPAKAETKLPAPSPGPWIEVDTEVPPNAGRRFVDKEHERRRRGLFDLDVAEMSFRARLLVGRDIGSLPDTGFGVGAAGWAQIGIWAFELGLWASNENTGEVEGMPGVGADFRLVVLHGRFCRETLRFLGRWAGCVGFEGGPIVAQSYGVDVPVREWRPWFAFKGELTVAWNLTKSISIRVDNQVGLPLRRERFRLLLPQEYIVHRPSRVHWRTLAGVERSFR